MNDLKNMITPIPTRWVGPIQFASVTTLGKVQKIAPAQVPLATLETTLFFSVARGSKAIANAGGVQSTLLSDSMTRSITLEAKNASEASAIGKFVKTNLTKIQKEVVTKLSRFAQLQTIDVYQVANLVYLRIAIFSDNASGHNMVTLIADGIGDFVLKEFKTAQYVSVSGNMCVDKKVSVINGVRGRGKHVITEITIPRTVVEEVLKTTPEKIVDLNIKKNLLGSIMAGSVNSANAHYANMLLAIYLATGQDAANIVEGSQGITYAEIREGHLYFSTTIPNIIVGTVGNGKSESYVQERLEAMGCRGESSSQTLAHFVGATVLAGELSLLAALTNPHELMKAHTTIERK
ncbi:MAG: hydroxymethylglutaryl-CoA reductase [Firmicutes bacterium]|nr:hydroxymethylglutaryl-CoA reductase [Bacillota bacterium]